MPFDWPYGELAKREFNIRFGIVRSVDNNAKKMKIEMCDTPGVYVDIYFQNMVQPMLASGLTAGQGWGVYTIPTGNIGTVAVICFYKNEFPLVLGYMASDYRTDVATGKLDDIKSGEIKIKCVRKSEIYLDENGNLSIKCFAKMTILNYNDPTATAESLRIEIDGGNIVMNNGTKNVARVGDTAAANSELWTWINDVSTATGVTPPTTSTIVAINSGTSKIKVD